MNLSYCLSLKGIGKSRKHGFFLEERRKADAVFMITYCTWYRKLERLNIQK